MATQSGVFLSYAHDDDPTFVRQLHDDLKDRGFSIWWDQDDVCMESRGETFLKVIRDAIETNHRLIAVIGPHAIASDYVRYEWENALLFSSGVVPILRKVTLDQVPEDLAHFDCRDFTDNQSYEKSLGLVVDDLEAEVPKLGPIAGMPALPSRLLTRTEQLEELQKAVLADHYKPEAVWGWRQVTLLHGMGGVGKSVLAADYAHLASTRRAFANDGIVWLRAAKKEDRADPGSKTAALREERLKDNLAVIGVAFDDKSTTHYSTSDNATTRLQRDVLPGSSVLIILDDAWDVEEVTPYVNLISRFPTCRLLVTSRVDMEPLGAHRVHLEQMTETRALQLLARWSGLDVSELPPEASEVAEECGRLPLALALCGGMLMPDEDDRDDQKRWETVLRKLQSADLEYFDAQLPNYDYRDLFKAMQVSVQAMEKPNWIDHYHEFAAFPGDVADPEPAIVAFWLYKDRKRRSEPGASDLLKDGDHARSLLNKMGQRALLKLNTGTDGRLALLHRVQHDYVSVIASTPEERLRNLHRDLVESYREQCGNDWPSGPDDGHFFEYLPQHLEQAGLREERDRLLVDYRWMRAKLDATSYWNVAADYERLAGDASRVVEAVVDSVYGSPGDKARILRELGTIYEELGHRKMAEHALTAAEGLTVDVSDDLLRASILTELGKTWFHLANFEKGREAHVTALGLYEALARDSNLSGEHKIDYGWCLEWNGEQERNLSRMDEALELHERACDVANETHDKHLHVAALQLKAHATANIGAVHFWRLKYVRARDCWKAARDLSVEAGDTPREAHYTIDIGFISLLADRDDLGGALDTLDTGIEMARAVGSHENEVRGLMNKASMLFAGKDYDAAESLYLQALKLSESEDVPRLTWRIQHNLGNVYIRQADAIRTASIRAWKRRCAETQYRTAVDGVEWMMNGYSSEKERRDFIQRRLNPFRAMIAWCVAHDDPDGAREYVARGLDPSLQLFLEHRQKGTDLAEEEAENGSFFHGCYVETE